MLAPIIKKKDKQQLDEAIRLAGDPSGDLLDFVGLWTWQRCWLQGAWQPIKVASRWLHSCLKERHYYIKITPSWPHDNIQPLRRMFCFMLMLHKSSFEKACGNTIWCCSDEIRTRQVQEDNLRKRPQMSCVSAVRSSEFELLCPRRSITEGSEMCSDKHQCLWPSCWGEGGRLESSLQQNEMKSNID